MKANSKKLRRFVSKRNLQLLAFCSSRRILTLSQAGLVIGLDADKLVPGTRIKGIGLDTTHVEVKCFYDLRDISSDLYGPDPEDIGKAFEKIALDNNDYTVNGPTITWTFDSLDSNEILDNARVFLLEIEHLYRLAVKAASLEVLGTYPELDPEVAHA